MIATATHTDRGQRVGNRDRSVRTSVRTVPFWSQYGAKGGFQVSSSGNTGPTPEQQSVDVFP